jgi:hypothetical protein
MKVQTSQKYIFIDANGNEILVRCSYIDKSTGLHSFKPIIQEIDDLAPHLYKLVKIETITISALELDSKIKSI